MTHCFRHATDDGFWNLKIVMDMCYDVDIFNKTLCCHCIHLLYNICIDTQCKEPIIGTDFAH